MSEQFQYGVTVIILRDRYEELVEAEAKLKSLEVCGVDSWEGFDDAIDLFREIMSNDKSSLF